MMHPFFCDAPPPTANTMLSVIRDWVVIGSCLATVGLFFQGRRAQQREKKDVRISDQPVEVSKSPKRYNHDAIDGRFVKIEDTVKRHDHEITDLEKKLNDEMPEMERRINQAGEDRSGKIHDRINDILGEVRELRGEMKHRS